ncbi:MAG: Manganese and iron superoxide dismutase [Parcubacteria group bacterium GW2011_GWF2_38_8]|nr:MAG: Manganese and iron superoxide dismutase [Parcubacteria group bacterium GW2011_GWF2_38_8]
MKKFEEMKFNIGELKGISTKNIEEHLKLYAGYVKNANAVIEKISELVSDSEKNIYLLGELFRRFSFEYNGMRNHEIYFDSLSGEAKPLSENGKLGQALIETFGSVEIFIAGFKNIAMARGIGWAVLWYDKKDKRLLVSWVDEQHLGQLQDCTPIIALDMWEHAYIYDYSSSEKKKYIEAFFENLNWEAAEKNFVKVK